MIYQVEFKQFRCVEDREYRLHIRNGVALHNEQDDTKTFLESVKETLGDRIQVNDIIEIAFDERYILLDNGWWRLTSI